MDAEKTPPPPNSLPQPGAAPQREAHVLWWWAMEGGVLTLARWPCNLHIGDQGCCSWITGWSGEEGESQYWSKVGNNPCDGSWRGGRGKQVSHQMLHEDVCDVEHVGAPMAHVRCVVQVVDGEIQCERLLTDLRSYDGKRAKACREFGGPNVYLWLGIHGAHVLLISLRVTC